MVAVIHEDKYYPSALPHEKGVVCRFAFLERPDVAESRRRGELVMQQIPVYEIITPNSKDVNPQKVPLDPVEKKKLIDRFPLAWRAFQGEIVERPGTPLTRDFHGLRLTVPDQIKYEQAGCTSWEAIADLSDAGCNNIGFGAVRMRSAVRAAMERPDPVAALPDVQLTAGMTAKDAILSMPGGAAMLERYEKERNEKLAEAERAGVFDNPMPSALVPSAAAAAPETPARPARKRKPVAKQKRRGKSRDG